MIGRRVLSGCLVALAPVLGAGCGTEPELKPVRPARPAPPQTAMLDWRESYGASGQALRFVVDELRLTAEGWAADVAVANDTRVPWRIERRGTASRFGVQLFADDDLEALEQASQEGRLPPERRARSFEPEPPTVLQPGVEWRGTISAPGKLPGGAYVRVVFGPFVSLSEPPEGLQSPVVWITDHAHRLAPR
jgi:hypothetical protein